MEKLSGSAQKREALADFEGPHQPTTKLPGPQLAIGPAMDGDATVWVL